MERVPGAKAQIREMAQANANPENKIVVPKVKVVREPAGNRAGEKAKAQSTVKDEEQGKAAGGSPKYCIDTS